LIKSGSNSCNRTTGIAVATTREKNSIIQKGRILK
jgi:hypothetical protein